MMQLSALPKMKTAAILAFVFVVLAIPVAAQVERCPYIENPPHREPLSNHVKERMIELCIEDNKKEFEKLLERTEQLAKLCNEIELSYAANKQLSKQDREKLEEAENLLSKIRKELKADDDDDGEEQRKRPESVVEAVDLLRENTLKLVSEIKKTTRHSISVVAIQSSNTVLKLVKWLKFNN